MRNESRLAEFLEYHRRARAVGDVDPQVACLRAVSAALALSTEERAWLSFLFSCCFSAPTALYIFSQFQLFVENRDSRVLEWWWTEKKDSLFFQTDRLRMKTNDLFVPTVVSYHKLFGTRGPIATHDYRSTWNDCARIKNFGRYSLFLYLELLAELAGHRIEPDKLEVASAKSPRDGLLLTFGISEELAAKAGDDWLEGHFMALLYAARLESPGTTAWSLETTLCSFKKYCRRTRWVGFYLDRQADEIAVMSAVLSKKHQNLLWDYRRTVYAPEHLTELTGKRSSFEEPYEDHPTSRGARLREDSFNSCGYE